MGRYTTTTIDVDGIEVTLDSNPDEFETIVRQPTPDTLVVGYLRIDSDCENPMTFDDYAGTLYTYNEGASTDDKSAPYKLGLNEFPGRYRNRRGYEVDYDLEQDAINDQVADKVMAAIKADPILVAWFTASVMETGDTPDRLLGDLIDDLQGYQGTNYDWGTDEDLDAKCRLPSYETLARAAWEDLYDEGKIGEYLAVPVRYEDSVHGPGTTRVYTTTLDDCNAVWVPDKGTIESMNFDGCENYLDKLAVADKYASDVLKSYSSWANGDCYGVTVETFRLVDGEYVSQGEDACWGYIGWEWAEQELEEQMDFEEKKFREKEAA